MHLTNMMQCLLSDEIFYIQLIPGLAEGDNNVYDFNYNKIIVVNAFYRYQMKNEIKQAWFNRANFLNCRHQNGQFLILPIRVREESFLRSILRRECQCFRQMMIRALVQKNMCSVSMQSFNLPYTVYVEGQAMRQTHVALMLLTLIFGETFRKVSRPSKIIANSSKYPVYLHYFSADRLREVFFLQEMKFSSYYSHRLECNYMFASYCILGYMNSTETFTAYNISEVGNEVQWQWNLDDNTVGTVLLRSPTLLPDRSGYDVSASRNAQYRMVRFYPISLYLTDKHYRNFIFIAARVCLDSNGLVIKKFRHKLNYRMYCSFMISKNLNYTYVNVDSLCRIGI